MSTPEYVMRAVRKYQRTEKGKASKARAGKKYRQTHAEDIAALKRKYYHSLSPEEKAERNRRYNWRRRYGVDPIQLDGKCAICGSSESLELDHKHPIIRGGKTTPDNLWTLCRSCNAFKNDRLMTPGGGILV